MLRAAPESPTAVMLTYFYLIYRRFHKETTTEQNLGKHAGDGLGRFILKCHSLACSQELSFPEAVFGQETSVRIIISTVI